MRACPSCRRAWPEERESCPECLCTLVDDLDATVTCPECGQVCPARMQSCPACLALLRPTEVDLGPDIARVVAAGLRMHRPAGRTPFAEGPGCSLLRLRPQAGLVLCGADGLIEANLAGPGIRARPPLVCTTDGTTLFRLAVYEPAARGVVALDGGGAPLGTYLHEGGPLTPRIEVRDETSAPVARVEPASQGGFELVETGGALLGTGARVDVEDDGWVDDQWTFTPTTADLPIAPLAFVALTVAAKVLLGRPEPVRVREPEARERGDDLEDMLGPIGRTIVEGFLDG